MAYSYPIGEPAFTPERRNQFGRLVREGVAQVVDDIVLSLERAASQRGPDAFLAMEQAIVGGLMTAASQIAAGLLGYLHRDAAWVQERVTQLRERSPHPTRTPGWRPTPVQFLGGARVLINTPYCVRDLRSRPGRTRGSGRRGASGSGSYPVLEALGVARRATPALQSEVARHTVRGGSFEEAYFEARRHRMRYRSFRRRGIPMGSGAVESAIRRVVNLRLKGPSIFWRGPNAERMLHMRAYFKAGRWDELMQRVFYASPSGTEGDIATRGAA